MALCIAIVCHELFMTDRMILGHIKAARVDELLLIGSICLQMVTGDIYNYYLVSWLNKDGITYSYYLFMTVFAKGSYTCNYSYLEMQF